MMKKIVLLLMALAGTLSLQAEDYTYLTFETTSGEKVSVPASSLTISISGTTLTAGSQTFTITNLSKMYFSNTDITTGIGTIGTDDIQQATEIYDLHGHKVPRRHMHKGVYIVKTKEKTYKIVKK